MTTADEHLVINRARGEMVSVTATAVHVRQFPPLLSDESPARGGESS